MDPKKKDLEIVYNLQWKDKLANGGDKANVVGMYDIPATTLNWEIFKSYLLKNSGVVGEDVKVSYITDSNREFPIDSQTDFQIALYAFRRKARMGDVVNLKLERTLVHATVKQPMWSSNDVETQFDNNEVISLASNCCNADTPPEWFLLYMNQFKKEVKDDITNTVSGMLSNLKPHTPPQLPCYHSRKSKAESSKRLRKLQPHTDSSHESKDLLKSLKIEGKLEKKLEKLEHKTKKIREKKIALFAKSSDSEAGHSRRKSDNYHISKHEGEVDEEYFKKMNGSPVVLSDCAPHMLGGEVYMHKWKIINNGKVRWPQGVTLNYTWGAKSLKPLENNVAVKSLNPNELEDVSVRFQIPNEPGHYECYWHLHYCGRRFGHWFGCEVIVDPFDLKGHKSVMECSYWLPFEDFIQERTHLQYNKFSLLGEAGVRPEPENKYGLLFNDTANNFQNSSDEANSVTRNITRQIGNIKLQDPTDTNCSSDSDNQSIISLNELSSRRESKGTCELFLPECFNIGDSKSIQIPTNLPCSTITVTQIPLPEERQQINVEEVSCDNNNNNGETNQNSRIHQSSEDILSNYSEKSDFILVTLNDDIESKDEYAYVMVEGQKSSVLVPKKIIKSEYLETSGKRSREGTLSRASSSGSSVEIVNKTDFTTDSGCSPKNEQVPVIENIQEVPSVRMYPKIKEYLAQDSTESIPQPLFQLTQESLVNLGESVGHCSAAGSAFSADMQTSSRVFVFPEDFPGYEVHENSKMFSDESNSAEQLSNQKPVASAIQSTPPLNLSTHDRNPFSDHMSHIPNFQQTPPNERGAPEYPNKKLNTEPVPPAETFVSATEFNTESLPPQVTTLPPGRTYESAVHILPETLVTGAVNVASSAINTAKSVINMIRPQEQPGTWVNGRWVSANTETIREANLQSLAEMGFWNRDLNATLLARFNDDLTRVVTELLQ